MVDLKFDDYDVDITYISVNSLQCVCSKEYDVAVVDEIQLIGDESRCDFDIMVTTLSPYFEEGMLGRGCCWDSEPKVDEMWMSSSIIIFNFRDPFVWWH